MRIREKRLIWSLKYSGFHNSVFFRIFTERRLQRSLSQIVFDLKPENATFSVSGKN